MRSLGERGNFDADEIVMLRDFGMGFTHSHMGRASGYHNSLKVYLVGRKKSKKKENYANQ
jgi:hypothetical protein